MYLRNVKQLLRAYRGDGNATATEQALAGRAALPVSTNGGMVSVG